MAVRRWIYDRLRGVFRRGKTEATGVELRDAFAARSALSVSDLAGRLARGEIALAAWSAEMATQVRGATIAQFLLGIGGTANLTDLMRLHLGEMVGEQLGYLRGFAREIAAGGLTEADIARRAAAYFDTAIGAYEQGRAMALGVVLPQYPPAHPLCRCWLDYATVGRTRTVSWRTSADERVCPICSDLESRYANVVIGAV